MKLYLDDDSLSEILLRLLIEAGHDAIRSIDAGMGGSPDPVHLKFAIEEDRILLTGNHKDFDELHELILTAHGRHAGVFVVDRENNPRRDMTPRGIVNAIRKLSDAGIAIESALHVLNDWR